MEMLVDRNVINIDKVIKRKKCIINHPIQVKIENAPQKIKVDPSQFIRKSYCDPQIRAHKDNPLINENKKPFKIEENENIRQVLK